MKYLLDTNLISVRDRYAKARTWILQHQLECGLAAVTIAEIAQGIHQLAPSRRRTELEKFLHECLEDFEVVPFDRAAALNWGEYVAKAGRPLPIHDSYIAATGIANGLTIATANTKDFPGCDTINPLED